MVWPVVALLIAAAPAVELFAAAGRLGAPAFRDREAAAGALLAAAKSPDPEARRRAEGLLGRLDVRRAWDATEVSVHADRKPLSSVLAELAAAGGCPIRCEADAPPVTVHLDRVPFWRALDAVSAAAGLVADPTSDGRGMQFRAGPAPPHVCYAGPYRLTATAVSGDWRADLSGRRDAAPPERLRIQVSLDAEPKAPVLAFGRVRVRAAEDDRGRPIRPDDGWSPRRPLQRRSHSHTLGIDLFRPDKGTAAIRVVRGTVAVTTLLGTSTELVVADPPAAVGRTVRGPTTDLTVDAAALADDQLTLSVTLVRSPGAAADTLAGDPTQRLTVADAAGVPWSSSSSRCTTGPNRATATLTLYRPDGVGRPATLTLAAWRSATWDVPFEFRDLPLPWLGRVVAVA